MGHPRGSRIQIQERANRKHRRELIQGVKCAKGTIPRVYRNADDLVGPIKEPTMPKTWFDQLRDRIKTFLS